MKVIINKYLSKLTARGLAEEGKPVFLALDAEMASNRPMAEIPSELKSLFDFMNMNSVLYSEPAPFHKKMLDEITTRGEIFGLNSEKVIPEDCETRTFFHDIPIVHEFSAPAMARALSKRKSAILKGGGILSYGVVTPEQAYIAYSSTCFSLLVKYFHDSLRYLLACSRSGRKPDGSFLRAFSEISGLAGNTRALPGPALAGNIPDDEDAIVEAISGAGRAVVEHRLVDSCFGNASFVSAGHIYISQTGSSLDELRTCIDKVPLDGSSSVGITASSELSAHKAIYLQTGRRAILHGHPEFSVVLSMHCGRDCGLRGQCHRACPEKRFAAGYPVVPGEIGTGPTGLANTVPEAMEKGGAIVYGHGVFASGLTGFAEAFRILFKIEQDCRKEYLRLARSLAGIS